MLKSRCTRIDNLFVEAQCRNLPLVIYVHKNMKMSLLLSVKIISCVDGSHMISITGVSRGIIARLIAT